MATPVPTDRSEDRDVEDRLSEIGEGYLEQLQQGDTPDRQALLAAHPEIADLLGRHLRMVEILHETRQDPSALGPAEPGKTDPEVPDYALTGVPPTDALPMPVRVGAYRIVQLLGMGGMGEVYLAEQDEPIRRQVALKLIKLGMDTREVVARFDTERQALAVMNHPHIARVYEAGASETGRPYFVMEHVPGDAVTDYCNGRRLNTRRRLELFLQLCDAVQHAHQKGVIHRDLKPSNVLVTDEDGRAVPKIIDFGVAKATDPRGAERTTYTVYGQVIGTPEYMSPEQAATDVSDIDTRTDIYSLGVILYELLVGTQPFLSDELRKLPYDEIRRKIREDEPPSPSAQLIRRKEESAVAAQDRGTDAPSLLRALRGDLDWITMKALEKDRMRRYASASELAADILRHLNDEPVLARPASAVYRVRKFMRKRKLLVGAAVSFSLLLVGSVIGFAWLYLDATEARKQAEDSEQKMRDALLAADREADRAGESIRILTRLLRSADPGKKGPNLTIAEILEAEANALDANPPDNPELEADLRYSIGLAFEGLGLYGRAKTHLEKALQIRQTVLTEDSVDTLVTMRHLALIHRHLNEWDQAESLYRRALVGYERTQASNSEGALYTRCALVDFLTISSRLDRARLDEAVRLAEKSWEAVRERDPEDSQRRMALSTLARVRKIQGKYAEARSLLQELVALRERTNGAQHPDTLAARNNLGALCVKEERFPEAVETLRPVVEIARKTLGKEHPHTLVALANLANAQRGLGELDEAEKTLRFVLRARREQLDESHRDVLESLRLLGRVLKDQGDLEGAERFFRAAQDRWTEGYPRAGRGKALALFDLAKVQRDQGRLEEARPLFKEATQMAVKVCPPWNEELPLFRGHQGRCLALMGEFEAAEALLVPGYEGVKRILGEASPSVQEILGFVIDLYESWGKPKEAERYRSLRR